MVFDIRNDNNILTFHLNLRTSYQALPWTEFLSRLLFIPSNSDLLFQASHQVTDTSNFDFHHSPSLYLRIMGNFIAACAFLTFAYLTYVVVQSFFKSHSSARKAKELGCGILPE